MIAKIVAEIVLNITSADHAHQFENIFILYSLILMYIFRLWSAELVIHELFYLIFEPIGFLYLIVDANLIYLHLEEANL